MFFGHSRKTKYLRSSLLNIVKRSKVPQNLLHISLKVKQNTDTRTIFRIVPFLPPKTIIPNDNDIYGLCCVSLESVFDDFFSFFRFISSVSFSPFTLAILMTNWMYIIQWYLLCVCWLHALIWLLLNIHLLFAASFILFLRFSTSFMSIVSKEKRALLAPTPILACATIVILWDRSR